MLAILDFAPKLWDGPLDGLELHDIQFMFLAIFGNSVSSVIENG